MSADLSESAGSVGALCLLSGGLDSQLAVCVLREQGIDVRGVVFESPFFSADQAREAAQSLRIPLHVLDFTRDIIELVKNPKHGYGQCMNPCIDCHARMIHRAGVLMEELGLRFISTGEVLNERPMSQNRRSLEIVARESGYPDLVLRPLSAALLPETKPEKEGWVDRSRLLAFHGRTRKPQMDLAARYGIKDYPTPAGGCRLTEPNFSRRLNDLLAHEGIDDLRSVELLRYGRHFRLSASVKLIVGRSEGDNEVLEARAGPGDLVMTIEELPGPTALLPSQAGDDLVKTAAAVCARYSDGKGCRDVAVRVRSVEGVRTIRAAPASEESLEQWRV